MAFAISIKCIENYIKQYLKNENIEVVEIRVYKLSKKMYLFNILCIERGFGELKMHKSAIKHIANNTEGYKSFKHPYTEIQWSA